MSDSAPEPRLDALAELDRADSHWAQLDDVAERQKVSPLVPGAAGSWKWDIKNRLLRLDDQMAALYGVDADAAKAGVPTSTFFHPIYADDVRRIRIAVAGILGGAELFSKTYRIVAADGLVRWVEAHGRCHFDADECPECFSGVLIDVTARRRVEERLRIAQTAGGVGTFEHIPGYATALVSDQFCQLLGLNPTASLPVSTINRLVNEGSPPLLQMSKTAAEDLPYAEVDVTRPDTGEKRWLARRGEVIADGGELRHVGVIYDITASKRTQDALRDLNNTLEQRVRAEIADRLQVEEALRQAQKMEAVGQLTGGIAHDFNNLLTVILGNVDMALRRLGSGGDERVECALASAHKGAERAAALTQRLLAFSRRQPLAPKKVDVNRAIQNMADLLTRTLGETIILETALPSNLWTLEVDPNQLENAILNLAVNARDAMNGTGVLTLGAANVPQGSILPSGAKAPRDYLLLSVSDAGSGMSPETVDRAFEPFFTTKEVGKGTGLGLSMVYGFVKQSDGDVAIQSSVGSGTTVSLYLPRASSEYVSGSRAIVECDENGGLNETILVVEDDEDVRQFAVDCLSELGYDVLQASDGPAALLMLNEADTDIQLLVTDVVMPHISGRQLAEAAQQLQPGLPVLYVSGYPREVVLQDGRLREGVELLSKPFTQQALAARVRDLLDRLGQ